MIQRPEGFTVAPLYMFVALLHKEAGLVSVQIRLVSERKLKVAEHSFQEPMPNSP